MTGQGGDTYNMNHPNRGTFYLYNKNVRDINDDLIAFENSFKNLGFRIPENRDRMDKVELFHEDVRKIDFSSDDCIFFVALSYNTSSIDYTDYTNVFSDNKNPQLRDKPKLFFFIYQENTSKEENEIEFDENATHSPDNNASDMLIVEIYTKDAKKTLEELYGIFKCIEYSRRDISVLLMQLKEQMKIEEIMKIMKIINRLSKKLCFGSKE